MLVIVRKLLRNYETHMIRAGRKHALEVLLRSSDRTLADAGFSRTLLEQGLDAWPWRSDIVVEELPPVRFDLIAQYRAARELEQCSDRELSDLGLSRGTIDDAIRHGRTGIEKDTQRKVA